MEEEEGIYEIGSSRSTTSDNIITLQELCMESVIENLGIYKKFPECLSIDLLREILKGAIAKHTLNDETLHLFLSPGSVGLDLSNANNLITDHTFLDQVQHATALQRISLARCLHFSFKTMQKFFQFPLASLTSINLSRCATQVNDEIVTEIAQHFNTRLKSLDLTRCPDVTDVGVETLSKYCVSLKSLLLFGCTRLSNFSFFNSIPRLTSLQTLSLSRCSSMSDDSSHLLHLLNSCSQLTNLNLCRCRKISNQSFSLAALAPSISNLMKLDLSCIASLSDASARAILEKTPLLDTLYLVDCSFLSNDTISIVAENCGERLEKLYISNCGLVSDIGILSVALHCSNLKVLNVSRCNLVTSLSISSIAIHCKKLNTLYLAQCENISGRIVKLLKENSENLLSLDFSSTTGQIETDSLPEKLNVLDLSKKTYQEIKQATKLKYLKLLILSEADINDKQLSKMIVKANYPHLEWLVLAKIPKIRYFSTFIVLLSQLKSLTKLFLSGCSLEVHLTDTERDTLSTSPQWNQLEYLYLSGTKISDQDTSIILTKLPNLVALVLSKCDGLTNATFKNLVFCTRLQSLDLSYCAVTNDIVEEITAANSKSLLSLTLSHCQSINGTGVRAVLKNAVFLQSLLLSKCKVDLDVLSELLPVCTKLSNLVLSNVSQSWKKT